VNHAKLLKHKGITAPMFGTQRTGTCPSKSLVVLPGLLTGWVSLRFGGILLGSGGCPAMKFSPMFPIARSRHSGNFFENFLENIRRARG
jgi:hypothetical protein